MKKILLIINLTLITSTSFGQWLDDNYILSFDDTSGLGHLTIDTLINQNNLWQIGHPQKTTFTTSFSSPNVIITDTLNSYPSGDTSSFIILNIAQGGGFMMPHTAVISGEYSVDSDSLSDFGTIEFSPDMGTTWIDLVNDTTYASSIWWFTPKPTLTGNSNGWQNFNVNIAPLGPIFNIQDGDTLLYRFTFISDSIQTNKDGLMFDDFYFEDYIEGIQEIRNDNLISISPNPANQNLFIQKFNRTEKQLISIFNNSGKLLFENRDFQGESIDTKNLLNGIYILKYSNSKTFAIKKFLVQH